MIRILVLVRDAMKPVANAMEQILLNVPHVTQVIKNMMTKTDVFQKEKFGSHSIHLQTRSSIPSRTLDNKNSSQAATWSTEP